MKRMLFSIVFISAFMGVQAQTTHAVEAGGMPTGGTPPYFSPQFITINQGDIVEWTNVQGTHAIDGTTNSFPNNPESFTSGNAGQGWVYSHTFNVPGFYNYECPVGNHALTQFGTITVLPTNSIAEATEENAMVIYPNPTNGELFITSDRPVQSFAVMNLDGKLVVSEENAISGNKIQLNGLSAGYYLVKITTAEKTETHKIAIQ
ncbi:MAG: T9SS type A sorting domain-containing protein [Cryomorphaceae bacterium]|nr:T9SS type A sorting domain-containing protein [Cryomorphaceae bacterium]